MCCLSVNKWHGEAHTFERVYYVRGITAMNSLLSIASMDYLSIYFSPSTPPPPFFLLWSVLFFFLPRQKHLPARALVCVLVRLSVSYVTRCVCLLACSSTCVGREKWEIPNVLAVTGSPHHRTLCLSNADHLAQVRVEQLRVCFDSS